MKSPNPFTHTIRHLFQSTPASCGYQWTSEMKKGHNRGWQKKSSNFDLLSTSNDLVNKVLLTCSFTDETRSRWVHETVLNKWQRLLVIFSLVSSKKLQERHEQIVAVRSFLWMQLIIVCCAAKWDANHSPFVTLFTRSSRCFFLRHIMRCLWLWRR